MLGRLKLIVVFEAIGEGLVSCGNVSVQLLRDGAIEIKRVIFFRKSLLRHESTISGYLERVTFTNVQLYKSDYYLPPLTTVQFSQTLSVFTCYFDIYQSLLYMISFIAVLIFVLPIYFTGLD